MPALKTTSPADCDCANGALRRGKHAPFLRFAHTLLAFIRQSAIITKCLTVCNLRPVRPRTNTEGLRVKNRKIVGKDRTMVKQKSFLTGGCSAIILIIALTAGVACAEQFVLFNGTLTYVRDGSAGVFPVTENTPNNWKEPVNYYDGTIYIRADVPYNYKPNERTKVNYLCRLFSGKPGDRSQGITIGYKNVMFTKPGLYHFQEKVSSAIPMTEPSKFRWDVRPTCVQPVIADANGQIVSKEEPNSVKFIGEMRDYLPCKVRFTMIVVAKDSNFVEPPWWRVAPHSKNVKADPNAPKSGTAAPQKK